MNETLSQVQNLEENLLPAPAEDDLSKPRMPFQTNLVLTRKQEDALVEHALERIKQLEQQLQRSVGEDGEYLEQGTHTCHPDSFFGKRELFTKRYYNHVKDRAQRDTIYEHSNLTASLSQRITCQMVAKGVNFFFGAPDDRDWFTAEGIGVEDEVLSEKIKQHGRWKFAQCGIKPALSQALEFAFVRGEAVVKVTHQTRGQIYKRKAVVLMGTDGKPMFDAHGDYILQGDAFDPQMAPPDAPLEAPMDGASTELAPPAAVPEFVPTGRMILRKDGVTVLPDEPVYQEQVITRRLITFNGPEAELVYYKDFLCSEAAKDIQTTDFIAQLFDGNAMRFAEMISDGTGDSGVADMQSAVERLRGMLSGTSKPKAASGQPREDFSETDTSGLNSPVNQWAECYLTYNPFEDDAGQYEIQLIVDRTTRAPIFYEYTANVTTSGLRPYRVIRNKAVDGRWYGMGSMEFFAPEQEFIDLQINRKNFGDSAAGRVTAFHPWMCEEGQRDPHLKMHTGQTLTMRDGYKLEDMVQTVYLQNDAQDFMELLQLYMQLMQLKSGVINAGDQQMSGLPSSNLATGINEVRDSGEELFSLNIATLFPGMSALLQAVVETTYANHNEKELFAYFNGEANEILSLTPDDVRDLPMNVTFVLSRTQERRTLEMADRVDNVVDRYYARPPVIQQRTANLARGQLKALRVSQAEKVIEPMDPLAMGVGPDGQPLPENVETMPQQPAQSMI